MQLSSKFEIFCTSGILGQQLDLFVVIVKLRQTSSTLLAVLFIYSIMTEQKSVIKHIPTPSRRLQHFVAHNIYSIRLVSLLISEGGKSIKHLNSLFSYFVFVSVFVSVYL